MNKSLTARRMAEYTIVNKIINDEQQNTNVVDVEGVILDWMEEMLNKYSNDNSYLKSEML
ncbi:hypothetical protein [Paenibacillus xylanexedens]|uniref:hypothetical protein n=1 Tax=Paenibacillus xylanexedens TaxID=528191 RepID=UPI000F54757F|nr:hypothetical protein [Paenibacillus xylanexedens]